MSPFPPHRGASVNPAWTDVSDLVKGNARRRSQEAGGLPDEGPATARREPLATSGRATQTFAKPCCHSLKTARFGKDKECRAFHPGAVSNVPDFRVPYAGT